MGRLLLAAASVSGGIRLMRALPLRNSSEALPFQLIATLQHGDRVRCLACS